MRHFASMQLIAKTLVALLLLTLASQSALATDDLQTIRQAAEENRSPQAQYKLGLRYLQGKGVNQDSKSALMWLERAAEQNYAPAQYKLGELYYAGTGVDVSPSAAVEYLTNAAEQGHSIAQYKLGIMYMTGDAIEKDIDAAREWLELAAEHGHKEAEQALTKLDEEDAGAATVAPTSLATPTASKTNTALAAVVNAAEQGDAEAQYQLGERFSKGRGVKRNKKNAQKWYKAAAKQGHVKAKYRLRGCGFC